MLKYTYMVDSQDGHHCNKGGHLPYAESLTISSFRSVLSVSNGDASRLGNKLMGGWRTVSYVQTQTYLSHALHNIANHKAREQYPSSHLSPVENIYVVSRRSLRYHGN